MSGAEVPQTNIVFQYAVPAEVGEVEPIREGNWTGPDSLKEQKHRIAMLDIEPLKHAFFEDIKRNSFTIAGEVAMIGQGVQTRTRTAGLCLTVSKSRKNEADENEPYSRLILGLSILWAPSDAQCPSSAETPLPRQ